MELPVLTKIRLKREGLRPPRNEPQKLEINQYLYSAMIDGDWDGGRNRSEVVAWERLGCSGSNLGTENTGTIALYSRMKGCFGSKESGAPGAGLPPIIGSAQVALTLYREKFPLFVSVKSPSNGFAGFVPINGGSTASRGAKTT
jgi:hypothetical protein